MQKTINEKKETKTNHKKLSDFLEKTKDYILAKNEISIAEEKTIQNIQLIFDSYVNQDDKNKIELNLVVETLKKIKAFFKETILATESIELKNLLLICNALIKEFSSESTALVLIEQPEEEIKEEEEKETPEKGQLSLFDSYFNYAEKTVTHTYNSERYEKEKIKVKTVDSPDYDEIYITVSGKIFADDVEFFINRLRSFQKLSLKIEKEKLKEKVG